MTACTLTKVCRTGKSTTAKASVHEALQTFIRVSQMHSSHLQKELSATNRDGLVNSSGQASRSSFHYQRFTQFWRLPDWWSTLQVEVVAIPRALNHALTENAQPVIIHTVSKLSLPALSCKTPRDNVSLTSISAHLQQSLKLCRFVVLHLTPSHVGIPGNETAEAAKSATRSPWVQLNVVPTLLQL